MRSLISCYLLNFPLFSVFFPLLFGFWWNERKERGGTCGVTTWCSHICTETRFLSHCSAQDAEFLSLFYIPERSTNGQVAADHGIVGNNIWALPVAATSGLVPGCRYICQHWCFGLVFCTYHELVHVCACDGVVLLLLSFFVRIFLADFAVLENCALSARKWRKLLVCRRKEVNLRVVLYTSH